MPVISSRWLRLSRFIVPAALVLLLTFFYWNDPEFTAFFKPAWTIKGGDSKNNTNFNETSTSNDHETADRKQQFIQQASTWEIDGPFNPAPLSDLCKSKKWQPGLIFKCDDAFGGVGNIRNIMLTCLRYAIEAGGQSKYSIVRIC